MIKIKQILEQNEVMEWNNKPKKQVISLLSIIMGVVFGLIIDLGLKSKYFQLGFPENLEIVILVSLFFLVTILSFYFGKLWYKSIDYVITNKKIVLQSGIIGTDYTSIDFDKIKNVRVRVDILGKIFNVGTILIDSGKMKTKNINNQGAGQNLITVPDFDKFLFIENPYQILKLLNSKVSQRKEKLYSGRSDYLNDKRGYKSFVQETRQ